jgi:hypothetical protein
LSNFVVENSIKLQKKIERINYLGNDFTCRLMAQATLTYPLIQKTRDLLALLYEGEGIISLKHPSHL